MLLLCSQSSLLLFVVVVAVVIVVEIPPLPARNSSHKRLVAVSKNEVDIVLTSSLSQIEPVTTVSQGF